MLYCLVATITRQDWFWLILLLPHDLLTYLILIMTSLFTVTGYLSLLIPTDFIDTS